MRKKLVTIWFLFTACQLRAQDLPVLPAPMHVEQGSMVAAFYPAGKIRFHGLDTAAENRLQWHWQKFADRKRRSIGRGIDLILLTGAEDPILKDVGQEWSSRIGTEGYVLILNATQQLIAANSEAGLFYGLQTLRQLSHTSLKRELRIVDWPAFPVRAIYDDISRGPISTVAYVKKQIERLAEIKINYLSFYIEHVVQPLSHPDFAPGNGKFTIAEIRELSDYAAKFHMQLIGSFQSFGHMEKILSLPQYKPMGETVNMISPIDPAARNFLRDVIGELCDAFSAPFFNVNCDETFDLGKGRSKKYTDSVGVTKFYADHIRFLYDVVRSHRKQLMMWGDIALEHEEMLDMLPRDIIYLTWEYGNQPSFSKWIEPFRKRNLRYMVCPGILNSYRLFPDMTMAKANIDGFVAEGKEKGATGVITTVWDEGSTFLFSADWYGAYKAADKSWNAAADTASFDSRYAAAAYEQQDNTYTAAVNKLMELRKLPLTFNLNENIWLQKILPEKGRQLIINNSGTDSALLIVNEAGRMLGNTVAPLHAEDFTTLRFAIDQYRLLLTTRKQIPLATAAYERARITGSTALLQRTLDIVSGLRKAYEQLAKRFSNGWLNENQPYALDIALAPFDAKIKALTTLEQQLNQAKASGNFTDTRAIGLSVVESPYTFFQNWLLTGSFVAENGKAPAFLYAGDAGNGKAPKPGDLFGYHGQQYRWQKYASPNGGITQLDDFYPAGKRGVVYAYCTLTTEKAISIASFIQAPEGTELFCNGQKIFSNGKTDQPAPKEERLLLPLLAGANHILLKIMPGAEWAFSFRLAPGYAVTSQKHKYFLNTEKGNHEAE